MPLSSKEVETSAYLRLFVMGAPKCGKTHTCIESASRALGGVYVINSDDQNSLISASRVSEFQWDLALGKDPNDIEAAIREARTGVKEGRYKVIVWDTISRYSDRVQNAYLDATNNAAGEPDGRRAWPRYKKHLEGIIDRLFTLKAHVIVLSHFVEASASVIDGQVKKAGEGVVPGLAGGARTSIPAMFQDIVFLEKRAGKRYFVTASEGVFGPGCRSIPGQVDHVEADIGVLWKAMGGSVGKNVSKRSKKEE